jgi:hypothetical protein
VISAVKNDVNKGDVCNVHESKDVVPDKASRPNSSPPISESVSPLHKRSNIFKSKFLSKINSPSKSIAEEHHVAPMVQMNDI